MNKKQAIALSMIGALALVILLLTVSGVRAEPDATLPAAPAIPAAQAGIVSSTISYQGRLLDADGNPVNGTPLITFSLYSQPSGGDLLWQDWFDIPVSDGLFHVSLAPPLSLFDGRPLWLAVRVQGDPADLAPRQQLLPAPYALSLRPGALVSTSLPSAPVLRLVNSSSGQALSLHSHADTALWAASDAPFPAIYAENTTAGPALRGNSAFGTGVLGLGPVAGVKGESTPGIGVEGVSSSASGVAGRSTSGPGVAGYSQSDVGVAGQSASGPGGTFTSTTGAGLFASSDAGHALVTHRPSLVQGPNPKQIALLRWYPAIQTPMSFTVGPYPRAIAFDGANMWVACGDYTVHVLRASDGSHVMTPAIGWDPRAIAFDGANMWVVNQGDGTISVLRASDGSLVMTLAVGSTPRGIAFDGTNMWVTNEDDGTVSVLRAGDGSHVMTPTVGSYPQAIAFDGANMWVTNQNDSTVSVLRASDGSHVMTPTVGSHPQAIAFDGANMWVVNSNKSVSVVRASDGSHVMTLTAGSGPRAIAFDGANMWVVNNTDGTVSVLRASDGSHVMTLAVGSYPQAIAFDGANMWVVNTGNDTVSKR